jgi:hypothetical protein
MPPAEDFENALKAALPAHADEITVTDEVENGENILRARMGLETIGRVVIFTPEYPLDVSAKMPGFRISLTIHNERDWTRNMAYLIDNYRNLRTGRIKHANFKE